LKPGRKPGSPYRRLLDRSSLRKELMKRGCWLWDGCCYSSGYGRVSIEWRERAVHRVSFWVFKGDDRVLHDSNIHVLHKCDTPRCFRPSHLFLGNQLINMRDMRRKKRDLWAGKTHCVNGHLLTSSNSGYYQRSPGYGFRYCKTCLNARHRKYSSSQRAKGLKWRKTPSGWRWV